MTLFVTGLIIGGFTSWVITHIYYKKSSQDQKKIYDKLTDEVKDIILNTQKDHLSIKELNDLIKDKVTIKDSKDIYPYKFCPKCGSEAINRYTDQVVDADKGDRHLFYF